MKTLNPPWAARIFGDARDAIFAKAQALRLPMPTGMKAEDELGCGHFGCVYRTESPDIVFKITTDSSEAFFVGLWRKWFGDDDAVMPAGIVKYYAVYAIPGASYRKRDAYVLWREEAQYVGISPHVSYKDGQRRVTPNWTVPFYEAPGGADEPTIWKVGDLVSGWVQQGREFRAIEQRKQGSAGYWDWIEDQARKALEENDRFDEIYYGHPRQSDLWGGKFRPGNDPSFDRGMPWFLRKGARYADKAAWHIYVMKQIALEMVQTDYIYTVGEVLQEVLERRVVMADVHTGNVGHVERRGRTRPILAITDPGHVISLDRRNDVSEVEAL